VKTCEPRRRNRIPLYTKIDGKLVSHFSMHEFENDDGLVILHPTVLVGLERVRQKLNELAGVPIVIFVTDAVRTQQDLERLAEQYGWTDEGGTVSRDSKHLAKYGGIAVDIIAMPKGLTFGRESARQWQERLGQTCREYFDWVKDDYPDGHVHADNRMSWNYRVVRDIGGFTIHKRT